ncbi:hypothetical protein JW698_01930 [Candidatus Wolfebacteria bacterium]|nr:hypothetical protein [Candidatus Wolfebacteria bacterium]
MGKILCHDCQTPIILEGDEIKNGVLLEYKEGDESIKVFKCNDCYKKNPNLTNFRNCEVYSRIVGYLRPVSQWNEGKQQEYKEKKIFAQPNNIN